MPEFRTFYRAPSRGDGPLRANILVVMRDRVVPCWKLGVRTES